MRWLPAAGRRPCRSASSRKKGFGARGSPRYLAAGRRFRAESRRAVASQHSVGVPRRIGPLRCVGPRGYVRWRRGIRSSDAVGPPSRISPRRAVSPSRHIGRRRGITRNRRIGSRCSVRPRSSLCRRRSASRCCRSRRCIRSRLARLAQHFDSQRWLIIPLRLLARRVRGQRRQNLRRIQAHRVVGFRQELERQGVVEGSIELVDDVPHGARPVLRLLGQHPHHQSCQHRRNLPCRHQLRYRLFHCALRVEVRIVRRIS